jgi:hypothetical protein
MNSLSNGCSSQRSSQIVRAIFSPFQGITENDFPGSKCLYSSKTSYVGRRALLAVKIIFPSERRSAELYNFLPSRLLFIVGDPTIAAIPLHSFAISRTVEFGKDYQI